MGLIRRLFANYTFRWPIRRVPVIDVSANDLSKGAANIASPISPEKMLKAFMGTGDPEGRRGREEF